MSDTPRTDAVCAEIGKLGYSLRLGQITLPQFANLAQEQLDKCGNVELELNAANKRIKRLEEAGDAMDPHGDADCDCIPGDIVLCEHCHSASLNWQKAKQPIS